MAKPEDLTGQIFKLRERGVLKEDALRETLENEFAPTPPQRKLAPDYFARLVYCVLISAALAQFGIIIWISLR